MIEHCLDMGSPGFDPHHCLPATGTNLMALMAPEHCQPYASYRRPLWWEFPFP